MSWGCQWKPIWTFLWIFLLCFVGLSGDFDPAVSAVDPYPATLVKAADTICWIFNTSVPVKCTKEVGEQKLQTKLQYSWTCPKSQIDSLLTCSCSFQFLILDLYIDKKVAKRFVSWHYHLIYCYLLSQGNICWSFYSNLKRAVIAYTPASIVILSWKSQKAEDRPQQRHLAVRGLKEAQNKPVCPTIT